MIRYLYTLRSNHPCKSVPSDTIISYYNIIDYIPYAVLYIPVTIFTSSNLYFLIPFTFFHPSPNLDLLFPRAASGLQCSFSRGQLFSGLKSWILALCSISASKGAGCSDSLRELEVTGLPLVSPSSCRPVSAITVLGFEPADKD